MTGLSFRACCSDQLPGAKRGYVSASDDAFLALGEVIAVDVEPPAPCRSEAIHESAHAALTVWFGGGVEHVQIGVAASCHGSGGLDREARVIVSLAGRIAERWVHRCVELAFDDELIPWLEMIRCPGGGNCDLCKAIRGCVILEQHGPDEDVIRRFRALEQRAVDLVQRRDIWRAITAIADVLMERGKLTGAEVHAICAQFFP
jgi:hypothetical protein